MTSEQSVNELERTPPQSNLKLTYQRSSPDVKMQSSKLNGIKREAENHPKQMLEDFQSCETASLGKNDRVKLEYQFVSDDVNDGNQISEQQIFGSRSDNLMEKYHEPCQELHDAPKNNFELKRPDLSPINDFGLEDLSSDGSDDFDSGLNFCDQLQSFGLESAGKNQPISNNYQHTGKLVEDPVLAEILASTSNGQRQQKLKAGQYLIAQIQEDSKELDFAKALGEEMEIERTLEQFKFSHKTKVSTTFSERSYGNLAKIPDNKVGTTAVSNMGLEQQSETHNENGASADQKKIDQLIRELGHESSNSAQKSMKLKELQNLVAGLTQRALEAEKKVKVVELFTNSCNSYSVSRTDHSTSQFDTMINMFGEIFDNEDMNNNIKVFKNFQDSDCHFAFLYASPLVIYRRTMNGPILQPILWDIDFEKDLLEVKRILENLNCGIKFISSMASASSFGDVLRRNPMILHFCGHGVKTDKNLLDQLDTGPTSDYLLFEDKFGRAEVVDCDLLKTQIELAYKGKNLLEFVFVASCHSEVIGQVFLEAGASHVVCVKRDEKISDQICNEFTELFYKTLFCEKKTFCEAFEIALKKIKSREYFQGEQKKFLILVNNTFLHQCTRLLMKSESGKTGQGLKSPNKFYDLTPVQKYTRIPSGVDCFRGRKREIYEINELLESFRLVLIKGMMGIGKSSLVREFAVRILNRQIYQNGVIFVNLRGKTVVDSFFSLLLVELEECPLKNEFTSRQQDREMNIEIIAKILEHQELLLIIDNVDGIISKFEQEFYNILTTLIARVKGLKILLTGFSKIVPVQIDFTLKVYELGPLEKHHVGKLFLARCPRKILKEEIEELFKKYPMPEIMLGSGLVSFPRKNVNLGSQQLQDHPLIKFFEGHPQTILIAASLASSMNLTRLFEFYSEGFYLDDEGLAITRQDSVNNENETPTVTQSYDKKLSKMMNTHLLPETIEKSIHYAIEIIKSSGQENFKFLCVLSLFPSGVQLEDLGQLYPKLSSAELEDRLQLLIDYSAAQKKKQNGKIVFSANRLITKKTKDGLELEELNIINWQISKVWYTKLSKIFYNFSSLNDRLSRAATKAFFTIERNVKANLRNVLEIAKVSSTSTSSLSLSKPFSAVSKNIAKPVKIQIQPHSSKVEPTDGGLGKSKFFENTLSKTSTTRFSEQLTQPSAKLKNQTLLNQLKPESNSSLRTSSIKNQINTGQIPEKNQSITNFQGKTAKKATVQLSEQNKSEIFQSKSQVTQKAGKIPYSHRKLSNDRSSSPSLQSSINITDSSMRQSNSSLKAASGRLSDPQLNNPNVQDRDSDSRAKEKELGSILVQELSFESEEYNSDDQKAEKKPVKIPQDKLQTQGGKIAHHTKRKSSIVKISQSSYDSFELSGIDSLRVSSTVRQSQVVETKEEYEIRMQKIDQCALNIVSECIANVLNSSLNDTIIEGCSLDQDLPQKYSQGQLNNHPPILYERNSVIIEDLSSFQQPVDFGAKSKSQSPSVDASEEKILGESFIDLSTIAIEEADHQNNIQGQQGSQNDLAVRFADQMILPKLLNDMLELSQDQDHTCSSQPEDKKLLQHNSEELGSQQTLGQSSGVVKSVQLNSTEKKSRGLLAPEKNTGKKLEKLEKAEKKEDLGKPKKSTTVLRNGVGTEKPEENKKQNNGQNIQVVREPTAKNITTNPVTEEEMDAKNLKNSLEAKQAHFCLTRLGLLITTVVFS